MFSGKVYQTKAGEQFLYHNSISMGGRVWKSPFEDGRFNPTNSQMMTYEEYRKEIKNMQFVKEQSFDYQHPNYGQ